MSADTFSNPEVLEETLPEVEALNYELLAPTYVKTIIIEWFFYWLIAATIALIANLISGNNLAEFISGYIAAPYGVIILSVLMWGPKVARSRRFALRDKDLHYKSGIIWQKTISLPFNRIQHIEIESSPLDRLFKLATLKFFTAGGGSADMKIPGLEFDRASKLKAFVLEKTNTTIVQDEIG